MTKESVSARRQFLQFLAASPLLAHRGGAWATDEAAAEIANAAQALNVFDLEVVARRNLPVAHFAYLATGVEADATIQANRAGFGKFQIRARRLVDTSKLDTRTRIFGSEWPTPIVLSPVSSLKAFHPEGDIAVAKAAKARNHLEIMSTLSTASAEDIMEARGAPVWFQLYPTSDPSVARALVKRAEKAGCPVVVLTVDNPTTAGRETAARGRALDKRDCAGCHVQGRYDFSRKPMFEGVDYSKVSIPSSDTLTWDFVKRLQDMTSMKVVLKGVVTREDAVLALENRVDGVVVSNHGGRSEESLRSTIESLPEVVAVVGGKMPVLVDSGFRRGSDIFKAVALGADAVGVGRPYAWGLAAFGQVGVDRALQILRTELETTMRSMGAPSLAAMRNGYVVGA
jgi:isopentenyl diphosphate isomerase/L-lactate dehydrogenase-like FMN-dependent dehydrogenase